MGNRRPSAVNGLIPRHVRDRVTPVPSRQRAGLIGTLGGGPAGSPLTSHRPVDEVPAPTWCWADTGAV